MIFTMTLPNQTSVMTVKDLLEQEWLVPRKVRHFIRTRKGLLINGCLLYTSPSPRDA